jgi:molybdate transport system substrate-binding protein
MDKVAEAGLVDEGSRRALLSNRLAVVVPGDSTLRIGSAGDLAGPAVRRLSLANPEAVPAGRYARAWLEKAGVWALVSKRVVPAPDVRAALAAVEAGAVEAGIVYTTDAAIARRARVAYVVPEREGPRIVYPVAALKDRPHAQLARRVAECYAGTYARAVFERFGFVAFEAALSPPRGR